MIIDDRPIVTRALREAIDPALVEPVFTAAGATGLQGDAVQALIETASAAVARRMIRTGKAEAPWRLLAPPVTPELLERARQAVRPEAVLRAAELAGIQPGSVSSEALVSQVAVEVGAIARLSVRYANGEGRPVDHNCVAVGAARSAEHAMVSIAMPAVVEV
jgi:hypothetical protein